MNPFLGIAFVNHLLISFGHLYILIYLQELFVEYKIKYYYLCCRYFASLLLAF